jgi:hypothetical protein
MLHFQNRDSLAIIDIFYADLMHHIILEVLTNVSEKSTLPIFRVEDEGCRFLSINLKDHCKNLKSDTDIFVSCVET